MISKLVDKGAKHIVIGLGGTGTNDGGLGCICALGEVPICEVKDVSSALVLAKQLQTRFNFSHVAITLRESISASDNRWSAMLYTNGKAYFSKKYDLRITDRVGGGDSFGGGLIYALLNKYSEQDTIEFAVAASALKHSIQGDFNLVSVEEVKTLASGDGSGRVQR